MKRPATTTNDTTVPRTGLLFNGIPRRRFTLLVCLLLFTLLRFHFLVGFTPPTFGGEENALQNDVTPPVTVVSPSLSDKQTISHNLAGNSHDSEASSPPKTPDIDDALVHSRNDTAEINLHQQELPILHVPRIVLGILSNPSSDLLEARHILRTTYLSFDRVHQTSTPDRVCSVREFSTKPAKDWKPFECQLVFAFIAGGNGKRTEAKSPPSQWKDSLQSDAALVINASQSLQKMINRDFMTPESSSDWLILNVEEYHHSYKLWAWHQYISQRWNGTFDYVAHTHWSVLLQPTDFWRNEIFSPSINETLHSYVYAQVPTDNKSEERFGLFSKDLHQLLVETDPVQTYGALTANRRSLDNLVAGLETKTTSIELDGIYRAGTAEKGVLRAWDKYKDSLIIQGQQTNDNARFSDATNRTFVGPRILMGIFSMDSEKEKLRRATVRSTYLSYYNETDTPHRICSLNDLLKRSLPDNGVHCQMSYAFVMGSNPNGTTELLEPNASFPLIVSTGTSVVALEDEDDIVHLNIQENMEDGKSPTWFKYASTVVDEHVYFDYIAKSDTDTLIFPNSLLDEVMLKKCPPYPRNVQIYGGKFPTRPNPNLIRKTVGPVYFAGELYWMSPDLARFITSSEFDRKAVDFRIEDHAMGNFVHSYPGPIRRIPVNRGAVHLHPLKDVEQYRQKWLMILRRQGRNTTGRI